MNKLNRIHKLLFYALLVLLPTQIGLHFWPAWTFVLGRRVDYLSPTLFLTDIVLFAVLMFWFLDSVKHFRKTKKINKPSKINLFIFLAVGMLICFIVDNTIHALSIPVAVLAWVKFFEYIALGLYIVKTKPRVGIVTVCLGLAMLYSSIITIFQFFLQRSIGGILWWLGERTFSIGTPGIAKIALCNLIHSSCPLYLRPYATFPHPNVLGGFLGVALLLVGTIPHEDVRKLLPRGVRIQEPLLSFLQFILLGAGGVSLILTFSRSAWAMVLLAVVAIGISKRVNALKFRAILGGAIVFFAVMIFYIFSAHFSDESLIVREQLNSAAFSIIQFHPFIGVGLGNFLVALPSFIPSREVYFLQPAHNIYLLLLSQIGFFGIALLIVFAYFLILQFKKNGRSFGFKNKRSVFRICLLGLLFIGLIDHYSVTLQQGQLLLTLLISMSL